MRELFILAGVAACQQAPSEGEVCNGSLCADGLACVTDVGADYGFAASDDVCERPHAIYGFIAHGERGENRRVDEALAMIDGTFRMPRFADTDPSMATVPYASSLAGGVPLRCTGLMRKTPHDCLVPDWKRYYGSEISHYDRFVFYGLRMVSSLVYTAYFSPPQRIYARYKELTGKSLDQSGVAWLRSEARSLAFAIVDSFVADAHLPFALDHMPACYAGPSGYQNPNAVWAPALAHWDPTVVLADGGLHQAEDVPADCSGVVPYSFFSLRSSLWDRHGVAFRAMTLANSFYLFRGMLSEERRSAWLRVIRETGDALALPSSYQPEQNHGTSEAAALLQLGADFAGILPSEVTSAWLTLGRYRLNDLIVDTVFGDGFQIEQSPMYHSYVAVMLLEILTWMDARGLDLVTDIDPAAPIDYDTVAPAPDDPAVNGLNVSTTLDPRAVADRMLRAAVHIAQPDGWMPTIGTSGTQNLIGYQADVIQRYVDEGHSAAPLVRFFWSGGKDGTPPPDTERLSVFEDSGFVVMYSAFKPDFAKQTHVVFDTEVAITGHGHPDTLSVHLFGPDTTPNASAGTELLADSGFYSATSDARWFFRSTLAHNTVTVDGTNQCVRDTTDMRFDPYVDSRPPSCAELAAREPGAGVAKRGRSLRGTWNGSEWLYQSAFHTLYAGTTHRRAVLLIGRDILIVVDMLASDVPHTFSQTWHLAPRIPPQTSAPVGDGGVYHLQFARKAGDAAPLMSLHEATDGAELVLHYGDPPIGAVFGQGWYSTGEDEAEPNQVIELRRAGVASTAFASVFLLGGRAGERADVRLRRDSTSSGGITVRLQDGKTFSVDLENLADANAETVRVY